MEKTKIEWADSTWNPVTGCSHPCPYCYARKIANRLKGCDACPSGTPRDGSKVMVVTERLSATSKDGKSRNAAYPFGFTPTLHEYRLDDPMTKGFGETIFVCSMADLFGEWVPDEWIFKVFEACKSAAGHRYLFLTKNPSRYGRLAEAGLLPEGDAFWYGSTVTDPFMPAFWSENYHTFVSIEPILQSFGMAERAGGIVDKTAWAIIGAESGNRKGKVVPEFEWIEGLVHAFHERGKPVFMKGSLEPIWGPQLVEERPWG